MQDFVKKPTELCLSGMLPKILFYHMTKKTIEFRIPLSCRLVEFVDFLIV